jgi:hypothetical protein
VPRPLGDQAEQHVAQITLVKKPAEAAAMTTTMAMAAKAASAPAEHAAACVAVAVSMSEHLRVLYSG